MKSSFFDMFAMVFTFFITAFPENKRQIAPIDPKTTSIDRDGNIVL